MADNGRQGQRAQQQPSSDPRPKPMSVPYTGPVAGPLVVSEANPRYFEIATDNTADRKAVYLTGSHTWNNLQDGMGPGSDCAKTAEQLDFAAYLELLKAHGHNVRSGLL